MIAIDGKTLRRSFDDAARGNPLAVVTAFASAARVVVGQHSYRVAEGDSEILAARALLECLDLKGHLVTADAIHCQEETARAHWSIENGLHWILDVVFDEDRARNRKDHGPENLATLRKLALNILNRARPGISVRRKRKRSGWSNDFARSILGQMR